MEKEKLEKRIARLEIEKSTSKNAKDKLDDYIAASKIFEELLNKGLAKNRGFNLMSIEKKIEFKINTFSI
jgi:hypothetical protein